MHVIGLMYQDKAAEAAVRHSLGGLPGVRVEIFTPPDGHLTAAHLNVLVTDCSSLAPPDSPKGARAADYVLMVSEQSSESHLLPMLSEVVLAAAVQDSGSSGTDEAGLSGRERQVLLCIGEGYTHDQTARRLGISSHTVDTYVKRVRSKLGLGNKAELTRAALRYL